MGAVNYMLLLLFGSNFFKSGQAQEAVDYNLQESWTNASKKQREKLLELIRRLAEDDKEGIMAHKVSISLSFPQKWKEIILFWFSIDTMQLEEVHNVEVGHLSSLCYLK